MRHSCSETALGLHERSESPKPQFPGFTMRAPSRIEATTPNLADLLFTCGAQQWSPAPSSPARIGGLKILARPGETRREHCHPEGRGHATCVNLRSRLCLWHSAQFLPRPRFCRRRGLLSLFCPLSRLSTTRVSLNQKESSLLPLDIKGEAFYSYDRTKDLFFEEPKGCHRKILLGYR